MKIIIQAGGLGSRLRELTKSKPKGLVAAHYLPIIFHIFKKYPDDDFIIIGDYKFDVLDRYLSTFAKHVNYILLKSEKKGNAAGIREALKFVLPDEPFMIMWSDIILSDNFNITDIPSGCQVGVADFPCSWSFHEGRLLQKSMPNCGVGGLFILDSKEWLKDIPASGSFTDFLAEEGVPLHPISLRGSVDVGTMEAYNKIAPAINRSRPYNRLDFRKGSVVKSGLTPEAVKFIEREIVWYEQAGSWGFKAVPRLLASQPLTLEYIRGKNVFLIDDDTAAREEALRKIIAAALKLHSLGKRPANPFDIYNEYFQKTIKRLAGVVTAIPFGNENVISINGKNCVNVFQKPHLLRDSVLKTLMDTEYVPIHGDCQFTNTMLGNDGQIYFIDPRGYFGESVIFGDARYDWAKIYYSVCGNFDQFNIGNFRLDIGDDSVKYSIGSGGWEKFRDLFLELIPEPQGRPKEIELIHAIIWLSMASHAWEDFDSMCIAFYNGLLLYQNWRDAYERQP